MHFLFYYRAAELTKSTGRLTRHSSCHRWGRLSSPSHRAALRRRKEQTNEMKSVYAESWRTNVDAKLNLWGEITWISGLTARRSQSASLIDRQHIDLQRWLLHGDTITTQTSIQSRAGRKEHLNCLTHLIPPSLSFTLFLLSCAQILQGQICHTTFCLSPSPQFVFALDCFHGCCSDCLLLSLLWLPVTCSPHPSFCWLSSFLSVVKELDQGAANDPVLTHSSIY